MSDPLSFEIYAAPDNSYIRIDVEGDLTHKNAASYMEEAFQLGKQLGICRYLVDARRARNVSSKIDNYLFARSASRRSGLIPENAVAVILTAPNDRSHDFSVYTLRHHGSSVELLKDEAVAIRVLREKSCPDPDS